MFYEYRVGIWMGENQFIGHFSGAIRETLRGKNDFAEGFKSFY